MFKLSKMIALVASMALLQVAGAAQFEIRSLPNHGSYDCGSASNTIQTSKCSTPIPIQVVPVLDMQGNFSTCVAILPYNKINVHRTVNAERVTLIWTLPQPAHGEKWMAKFSAPGISLAPQDDSNTIDDLFEDGAAISNDKQSYVASMAVNIGVGVDFSHLPVIKYTPDSTVAKPKFTHCFGVDPLIRNSAD